MARMKDIKEKAKKRRAKYLAQWVARKFDTITELADFHHMTRSRMSKLLIMAKAEA